MKQSHKEVLVGLGMLTLVGLSTLIMLAGVGLMARSFDWITTPYIDRLIPDKNSLVHLVLTGVCGISLMMIGALVSLIVLAILHSSYVFTRYIGSLFLISNRD